MRWKECPRSTDNNGMWYYLTAMYTTNHICKKKLKVNQKVRTD